MATRNTIPDVLTGLDLVLFNYEAEGAAAGAHILGTDLDKIPYAPAVSVLKIAVMVACESVRNAGKPSQDGFIEAATRSALTKFRETINESEGNTIEQAGIALLKWTPGLSADVSRGGNVAFYAMFRIASSIILRAFYEPEGPVDRLSIPDTSAPKPDAAPW